MLMVSGDFILSHLMTITLPDFWIGVLKGGGIALMIKSLYLSSKQRACGSTPLQSNHQSSSQSHQ